ncbi:hypothetical protein [Neptuniibacter sp.]|uniref:hypothetical protein n=1 Tax=Neptuniibacter sp. TaxID=1962643 RepID=UPI003B5B2D4A
MKFITTDYSVRCMRETPEGDKEVVSFDINIGQVATHVAAALFQDEVEELNAWLSARSNLQDHLTERPDELNIIDVLPALIEEANLILKKRGKVDSQQKKALSEQANILTETLNQMETFSETKPQVCSDLGRAELLKAKLDVIKETLSKKELD